jgi:hypothetical protein
MKTFTELELQGIVGTYKENMTLYIITKDGTIWEYWPRIQKFQYFDKL